MISKERIFHVLESLYDSAREGSPEAWRDVYAQMACLFSSGPGCLTLYSTERDKFDIVTSTYSEETLKAYYSYFRHISPIHKKVAETPVGGTFWRMRDCPDPEFIDTEFYQDHLRKEDVYDIKYSALCERSGLAGGVSFSRPRSMPAFGMDELRAMEFLIPHLQRSFHLYLMFADAQIQNLQLKEAIGKSPRGIIFLNRSAKVVFRNEAADTIIARKDGLRIDRNGLLFASRPHDMQQLKAALNSVLDPAPAVKRSSVLRLSRPSGLRPLQLYISRFSEQAFPGYSPEMVAVLFVCDPEDRVEPAEDVLCRMYDLTPAEARLAGMMVQGISLKEAAELLNVRPSTIQTHMKRIFSKTDTNRQGELIALIVNSPAALKSV